MQTMDKQLFPDGFYLDYFLDRDKNKDLFKHVQISEAAKAIFQIDNFFKLLKYVLFNDTTNTAGAHFILLNGVTIQETVTLKACEISTISISSVLPKHVITSYTCRKISQAENGLKAIAIRNPKSPTDSLDVLPILVKPNLSTTATLEITIFAVPQKQNDDIIYSLLSDAFSCCQNKNYRYAIIAAQNAYELSAKRYFENYFSKIMHPNKAASDFFKKFSKETINNIATKYLPLLTSINNTSMPPEEITQLIKKLNFYRNNLSHSLTTSPISEQDLREMIIAAFFICKYFELMIPNKKYPTESFAATYEPPKTEPMTVKIPG